MKFKTSVIYLLPRISPDWRNHQREEQRGARRKTRSLTEQWKTSGTLEGNKTRYVIISRGKKQETGPYRGRFLFQIKNC